MVAKFWLAALFITPAVLGAVIPDVQENTFDLAERDESEIVALPFAPRAEADVKVAEFARAELAARDDAEADAVEADGDVEVDDADKKKKKKKGPKKGKKKGHKKGGKKGKKGKGKKGKKGGKKGPHDDVVEVV